MARTPTRRKPRIPSRPGRSWAGRIIQAVLGVLFLFLFLSTLSLFYLRWFSPWITTVQIQRQVEAWMEGEKDYKRQYRFVSLERIPPVVRHAVIAAEDGRFYEHFGFDWQEVDKVLDEARQEGKVPRGASTITQQLVKNLFLTTHRSAIRKILEIPLVPVAEIVLPKERILELYLNVVEWGPGVYGIESAARHHYGITASRLSREQAARLAAVLPAPLRRRPQRMDNYSAAILTRMEQRGW